MEPQAKLDTWKRKYIPNNHRLRNGAQKVTLVGGITPVWFSLYRENTVNFQSLYLGLKRSLIHDIYHIIMTPLYRILVEIHKFKKQLSHLVVKKSANSGFVPDRIEKSISGTTRAECNSVTDNVLLIILLHLGENIFFLYINGFNTLSVQHILLLDWWNSHLLKQYNSKTVL